MVIVLPRKIRRILGALGLTLAVALTANVAAADASPDLRVTRTCGANGSITITITNYGGAMPQAQPFTVATGANQASAVAQPNTYQLGAGQSYTVTLNTPYWSYTFWAQDMGFFGSSQDCAPRPLSLALSYACNLDSGTIDFTIRNLGSGMSAPAIAEIQVGNPVPPSDATEWVGPAVYVAEFRLGASDSTTISIPALQYVRFTLPDNLGSVYVESCLPVLPILEPVQVEVSDPLLITEITILQPPANG
jgi:hypothetical protein